jgi:hypothetical protein
MSVIDVTSAVSSAMRVRYGRPLRPAADPAQLIALREGAYRAPAQVRTLRVLAGCAWISQDGVDYILAPGEHLAIRPGAGSAVVSALGTDTLILEAETGRKF